MHLTLSDNINVTFLQCIHYATVKSRETRGEKKIHVFWTTLKSCIYNSVG